MICAPNKLSNFNRELLSINARLQIKPSELTHDLLLPILYASSAMILKTQTCLRILPFNLSGFNFAGISAFWADSRVIDRQVEVVEDNGNLIERTFWRGKLLELRDELEVGADKSYTSTDELP